MGKDKIKSIFDEVAQNYNQSKYGQVSKQTYPYMLNTLLPMQFATLLDVGCGNGNLIHHILDKKPQIRAFGVDFSEEMIKVAKENLSKRVELQKGDAESLPFQSKVFDVVVCTDLLRYCGNIKFMAREAFRVLKPNGKIVICDYYTSGGLRTVATLISGGEKNLYGENEIRSYLADVGFEYLNCNKVSGNCFIATGEKRGL